jgi:hypothetical protein
LRRSQTVLTSLPAEWASSIPVLQSGLAPLELLNPVRLSEAIPAEYFGHINVTGSGLIFAEVLRSLIRGNQMPSEALITPSGAGLAAGEYLVSLRRSAAAPAEIQGSIYLVRSLPLEFGGVLGVTLSGLTPIEWQSLIAGAAALPAETIAALQFPTGIPAEWPQPALEALAGARGRSSLPGEWLVQIPGIGVIPAAFGGSAVVTTALGALPFEWRATPFGPSQFTSEFLLVSTITGDRIIILS